MQAILAVEDGASIVATAMALQENAWASRFQYFPYGYQGIATDPSYAADRRSSPTSDRQLRHQSGRQRVGQAYIEGLIVREVLAHQLELALRARHDEYMER